MPVDVSDDSLKALFSEFGTVTDIKAGTHTALTTNRSVTNSLGAGRFSPESQTAETEFGEFGEIRSDSSKFGPISADGHTRPM